jgi:hypothetical protein
VEVSQAAKQDLATLEFSAIVHDIFFTIFMNKTVSLTKDNMEGRASDGVLVLNKHLFNLIYKRESCGLSPTKFHQAGFTGTSLAFFWWWAPRIFWKGASRHFVWLTENQDHQVWGKKFPHPYLMRNRPASMESHMVTWGRTGFGACTKYKHWIERGGQELYKSFSIQRLDTNIKGDSRALCGKQSMTLALALLLAVQEQFTKLAGFMDTFYLELTSVAKLHQVLCVGADWKMHLKCIWSSRIRLIQGRSTQIPGNTRQKSTVHLGSASVSCYHQPLRGSWCMGSPCHSERSETIHAHLTSWSFRNFFSLRKGGVCQAKFCSGRKSCKTDGIATHQFEVGVCWPKAKV